MNPFIKLAYEEIELHNRKNADYTQGGDPLGNFNRVADILMPYDLDMSLPECVAAVYMLKQLDAALWMIAQDYEGSVENVATRLQDVSVYAKLMSILHDQTRARRALEEADKDDGDEEELWQRV